MNRTYKKIGIVAVIILAIAGILAYQFSGGLEYKPDISSLPERSFIRRFTKAVGMTHINYVHALRLEEAKQMLETTDLPIEAVADETGYEDTSFFGRLFRRKTGLTPAHYRLRFGSLRRALDRNQRPTIQP